MHVAGDLRVPGDKSITHRSLMLAAAAQGTSRIRGALAGADCQSTTAVLRALGCDVPPLPADGGEVRVQGRGLESWRSPEGVLDCGNSGTTVRLMMGLLAGRPLRAVLTGDDSLRSRPMRRITEPLTRMGAGVRELEAPDRLPVELHGGALQPLDYRSPKASAQIKSAVLLAGLSGGVPVSVWEPGQSRDHSERMLQSLGCSVRAEARGGGWWVALEPPAGALGPLDVEVPGDPSSAAFLAALATLADSGEVRVRGVGLNPTRTGFFRSMERMGARIQVLDAREEAGEPVGDLVVRPAALRAIEVGAAEVPAMIDEIPTLAVLAARAHGETRITGAGELRAKESDRIAAVVGNLRALGAEAEELPDGLVVRGSDRPLAGRVRTYHDHRIAMAFGVLAALPGNRIELDHPDAVAISYPDFWSDLRTLTGTPSGTRAPDAP